MSNIAPFKVGQKVRCIFVNEAYGVYNACLNEVGVVHAIRSIDWHGEKVDIEVHFDHIVGDRTKWFFLTSDVISEPTSPEEMEHVQEKIRQAEQFRQEFERKRREQLLKFEEQLRDQQRRKAHADKYL